MTLEAVHVKLLSKLDFSVKVYDGSVFNLAVSCVSWVAPILGVLIS